MEILAAKSWTRAPPPEPAALVAWRQAVENKVLNGARQGIRSVVIRPAIVYGRGGGIPKTFADSARKEAALATWGTARTVDLSCMWTTWRIYTSSSSSARPPA